MIALKKKNTPIISIDDRAQVELLKKMAEDPDSYIVKMIGEPFKKKFSRTLFPYNLSSIFTVKKRRKLAGEIFLCQRKCQQKNKPLDSDVDNILKKIAKLIEKTKFKRSTRGKKCLF